MPVLAYGSTRRQYLLKAGYRRHCGCIQRAEALEVRISFHFPSGSTYEIAVYRGKMTHIFEPVEVGNLATDVGFHVSTSSSPPRKARLLSAIIRFCQTERCLEVGTGFGLSSLFIVHMLKARGCRGFLATVEGYEPKFSSSSEALKNRFGDMVSCHFGKTEDILPAVVKSMGSIDFMFHDGGHYKENYIRDFSAACTALVPGSVVLFDDIRYESRLFRETPHYTYEGWREVVASNWQE